MDNDQNGDMEKFKVGNYQYSAVKVEKLTGTNEYTLVAIVFDESGTTTHFAPAMEQCLHDIIGDLRYSPRANNLLVTDVHFGTKPREVHGYKLLEDCNPADYIGSYKNGGSTSLYDTCVKVLRAMNETAKRLREQDYDVNGFFVCITDGKDECSTYPDNEVNTAMQECITGENLESLMSILIGVNVQTAAFSDYLEKFKTTGGFSQFEKVEDIHQKSFAKIVKFISNSVTSQSQHLGTGGASKSLAF